MDYPLLHSYLNHLSRSDRLLRIPLAPNPQPSSATTSPSAKAAASNQLNRTHSERGSMLHQHFIVPPTAKTTTAPSVPPSYNVLYGHHPISGPHEINANKPQMAVHSTHVSLRNSNNGAAAPRALSATRKALTTAAISLEKREDPLCTVNSPIKTTTMTASPPSIMTDSHEMSTYENCTDNGNSDGLKTKDKGSKTTKPVLISDHLLEKD